MTLTELSPKELRLEYPSEKIGCKTTEELGPIEGIIGQERALKAMRFGIEMKAKGFNIYAAGIPLTGKRPATRSFLEGVAKAKPTPPDWVYVNNFQNSFEPKALKLPSGRGRVLQKDVKNFLDRAKRAVPSALQSDVYLSQTNDVTKKSVEERNRILNQLNEEAQRSGYTVRMTQLGISIIPVRNGKTLSQEEFDSLSPEVKKEYDKTRDSVRTALDKTGKQVNEIEARVLKELKNLRDNTVHYAIGDLVKTLTSTYKDLPEVVDYLNKVRDDILENPELFIQSDPRPPEGGGDASNSLEKDLPDFPFRKYEVNVMVDNSNLKGAPVISEDNPTVSNLLGKIEHEARFGALRTDFTLMKGGSLHKANGGYLILDAIELLKNSLSYDGLKRALHNGRLVIEETQARLGVASTKTLAPQAIPLNVKVVLVGDPNIYEVLYTSDPDFSILFKVKAQFDDSIERNEENLKTYGSFVHSLCEREALNHLEGPALAKVLEYGSRLAEDQTKLSTKFPKIADLVREASFYSTQDSSKYVKDVHVKKALQESVYRSNLLDEKVKEAMARGIILIDTSGVKVGQVNALSVISLGDFEFGQPSRITASLGLGRRGIINIEREAGMSGRTHTKGVLIISGYLENKYARDKPLSLSCRLVFEQSYGGIDGDSASSSELYAILSTLSGLPIKQNFAVTGSVNQKGEVQAIGGVNEKIEGFYSACKAKGFQGNESVLIPRSNIQHLMVSEEIVEAVKQGRFHIYAVSNIDEGIELLTGVKAGQVGNDGTYDQDTVNYRVDKRLSEMAEEMTKFALVGR